MSEIDVEVLKVYCDKQKVMIADLVAKVLMLETKLEVLEAQRKTSYENVMKKNQEQEQNDYADSEENINKQNNNLGKKVPFFDKPGRKSQFT